MLVGIPYIFQGVYKASRAFFPEEQLFVRAWNLKAVTASEKKKIDFQQHSKSGTKIYEELGKEAKEAE